MTVEHEPFLAETRAYCLSLPGAAERESHGSPGFFVDGKKAFVHYRNNHHGDGIVGLWCAVPPGMQQLLVSGNPELYYVPAYVGPRGWVGVRLDRGAEWGEIAAVIGEAYWHRAPKKYAKAPTEGTD
ncbi:Predicted DNA-binding protein, MmcQ/YjbR family [Paenibacillus sp. UNC496MF]|uniref:MmcQ/YjbR family DNA-binding protein n=1 Tax=Paenibacillus sp. UNC496MF TaxID=1502753 RepID=UPI0008E0D0E3|nr:MmcQ/YjbR family DNA-binding protein [Paenibacillus sp. UNC496MF]SFI35246.1 Predicted DNA-binding protein, MmcQ/YjbR family [Paenibacillus sp. UNC496MF]